MNQLIEIEVEVEVEVEIEIDVIEIEFGHTPLASGAARRQYSVPNSTRSMSDRWGFTARTAPLL